MIHLLPNFVRFCKSFQRGYRLTALSSLLIAQAAAAVSAEELTFTVNLEQSQLTLAAVFSGIDLVSQSEEIAGDTARYSGQLTVDVDNPLAPTEIRFVSAFVESEPTGEWLPEIGGGNEGDPDVDGDSDPGAADIGSYGLFLDAGPAGLAWGAFRDLAFNISSIEVLSVDDGKFTSGQLIEVAQGTWDTNIRSVALGDGAGSDDVTGDSAFNDGPLGSYTVTGNQARLEIPVTLIFPASVEFTFEGVLVATALVGNAVPGDYNGDGTLDAADINLLTQAVNQGDNPIEYDLNGDQLVDGADRRVWIEELRNTWYGDADLDGEFGSGDFVLVFQAGQYEDQEAGNSVWETGDWSGDTEFESGDFVVAFQGGGFERGPRAAVQAVPEPTTVTLIGSVSVILALACRRRTSAR